MGAGDRHQPQPAGLGPARGEAGGNLKAVAGTVVTVAVVMAIHNWLGVQPWGG